MAGLLKKLSLFTKDHKQVQKKVTTDIFLYPNLELNSLSNLDNYKPVRFPLEEHNDVLIDVAVFPWF